MPQGARGWRILYTTTLEDGSVGLASGIVVVPERIGPNGAPVIAWAHGTTGFAGQCAPSALAEPFDSGGMLFIDAVPASGWAFVATDYSGLGTAGVQPYLIGKGEAYSTLDAVRAARSLPGVALSEQTVVWGHSQGGHAALWAGQVSADYAPDVPLLGVAAYAPAANTIGLTKHLPDVSGGSVFASFVIRGYADTYPDVSFDKYVTPSARTLVREMSNRCLSEAGTLVSVLTALSISRDRPVFGSDPTTGELGARLEQNTPRGPFAAPVLLGQGLSDPLITPTIQREYVAGLCAAGRALDYREYDGRDHVSLVEPDSPAVAELLAWTADRFTGLAAANTC